MSKKQITPDSGKQKQLSFKTRNFGTVYIVPCGYVDSGCPAIQLLDNNDDLIAVLSVNLPNCAGLLFEGEFFARTWNDNEEIAEDALASGLFRDTGRTSVETVNAQIWKLLP